MWLNEMLKNYISSVSYDREQNLLRNSSKCSLFYLERQSSTFRSKYTKSYCCIEKIFSSDETEVQAPYAIDGNKSSFKPIENDITVSAFQLLYKLEQQKLIGSGNRVRYKFPSEIIVIDRLVMKFTIVCT